MKVACIANTRSCALVKQPLILQESFNMADTERQQITDEEDTIISSEEEEYKWVIVTSCFILNASTWGISAVSRHHN